MSKKEKQNQDLEEIKKQAEEYLNGWKRAKADLINFQKETEKQKADWIKFANSNLISALLPFCDNFEEALKYAPTKLDGAQGAVKSGAVESDFLVGIKQIKKQFDDLLKDFSVERIEVMNEKFNPEFHECSSMEESEEKSGIVIKEIQAGYKLNGKIIRPPKVVVAK